jgi:predicted ribosome quality control (RQC) complex YloA/Tae2 family protein
MIHEQPQPVDDRLPVLKKSLEKASQRLERKLAKQNEELAEARKSLWYRQIGDSLLANPAAAPRGTAKATFLNVHTQKEESVSLNPKFDFKENAQLLFKKSKKAERGSGINARKVAESEASLKECRRLIGLCDSGMRAENDEEKSRICSAIEEGVRRFIPAEAAPVLSPAREQEKIPYRRYSIDGWDVFIGRNDAQNDELSTRFAKHGDLWFHVAGHSGSHVIIRRPDRQTTVPDAVIRKTAALAVWFSKAKHTSYAEIHYTEARFVRKRRHALPGEVMIERYKSIRVSPRSPHDLFPSKYSDEEE